MEVLWMKELHIISIANSVIWGIVIIVTAVILRGTSQGGIIVVLLGGAASTSILATDSVVRKVLKENSELLNNSS
jgi:hypothetical protein